MSKPIAIVANSKETIFEVARRAMKNADCNNRITEISYQGQSVLVYPNDVLEKIIKFVKRLVLIQEIARLEARTTK